MKVYVVTAGEYSDYHIIGVATTKEMAEVIVNRYNNQYGFENWDCDGASISEFDTDKYEPLRTNRLWIVHKSFNVSSKEWEVSVCESSSYEETIGKVYVNEGRIVDGKPRMLHVYLYAVNEESAIKIASEKFAEYQAMEEGLV